MDDRQLKPIVEASYLTAGNAWRHRAILRYFFLQHEKMRYYLFPEEVLEHLWKYSHFKEYTEDQLQQDLGQLVEWKNLIPRQDMGKVRTIEEFKKKRFRYQCTPYAVEIERMVRGLEQKGDSFGGSLEKNLFERIYGQLSRIVDDEFLLNNDLETVYGVWEELFDNFKKLTTNASNYLAHLESEKVEEMMMTEAFLVYKESLTEYLRNFMTAMQRTSYKIEALLEQVSSEYIADLAKSLTAYYFSIPRLEEHPDKDVVIEKYQAQWQGLRSWFLGYGGRESDMVYLQNTTNETIRRMTRYAQRLGEKHHSFRSRKKDYLHLAEMFSKCRDLKDAHELSACAFGVFHTRHILADVKNTEDIYAEPWDIEPTELIVNPRIRAYQPKTRPQAVVSFSREKDNLLEEYLKEKEAEQKLIEKVLVDKKIILSKLQVADPYLRKTLLNWIGKCMGNKELIGKTEMGQKIKLLVLSTQEISIKWDDGVLVTPDYAFEFLD